MLKIKFLGSLLIALLVSSTAFAQASEAIQAENELKKYINNVVQEVKSTDDPNEKREIMNESLERLYGSLATVKSLSQLSADDHAFLDSFMSDIQEKQNELNGLDGFSQVNDSDLNDFADYMQQDMEQARTVITISLTTALLIALILVLIAS